MKRMFFIAIIFSVFFSACAENSSNMYFSVSPDFFKPYFPENEMHIEAGDILTIRFYYHPELNSKVVVRPDGRISLTFFQGLYVMGLTPEELQKKLVALYKKDFVDPAINVDIERRLNDNVFVTGEVLLGGMKALNVNKTIGQILSESGVIFANAALDSTILIRKRSPEEYRVYKIDARLENGKERDVYLIPGDTVFVPKNTITLLGDFVQKYIRNIIPMNTSVGLGFTYELHNDN